MREIKTWTVRPSYKLPKGRHKFKYVRGMIIARNEAVALELYQHFQGNQLEVTMQYETIAIKDNNDEES